MLLECLIISTGGSCVGVSISRCICAHLFMALFVDILMVSGLLFCHLLSSVIVCFLLTPNSEQSPYRACLARTCLSSGFRIWLSESCFWLVFAWFCNCFILSYTFWINLANTFWQTLITWFFWTNQKKHTAASISRTSGDDGLREAGDGDGAWIEENGLGNVRAKPLIGLGKRLEPENQEEARNSRTLRLLKTAGVMRMIIPAMEWIHICFLLLHMLGNGSLWNTQSSRP